MPMKEVSLALAAILALSCGCAVNPITGQEEMMFFGPDKDVELGRKYAPHIEKELGGRIQDENLQRYIHQVGQKIARVCDQPDIAYHFTAVEHKSANAIALPGGYIFITRGLLKEMKSESQLAAVLAHEVGHVVARDTMVAISRQLGMLALVTAAHVGGPARVARAADFITAVLSLQYSREDEKAADLAGLSYMTRAGYDPNSMVELMEILQELHTVRPVEFFSTHPNPDSRIAYLQERIARRHAGLAALKRGQQEYEAAVLSKLKPRRSGDATVPDSSGVPNVIPAKAGIQ